MTVPLPDEMMLLSAVAVIGGLYLFIRGFPLLARKRLLLNTPTSKIRSASLGLIEVGGLATGPYTLTAPITGNPCYLYRTTAWRQGEDSRSHEWKKAAEETLHVPFFLDDSTGKLLVNPDGAELDLHRDFCQKYDQTWFSRVPDRALSFLARHGITPDGDHFRIEEWTVQPQNPLFIVGTLTENSRVAGRPFPNVIDDKRSLALTRDDLQGSPVMSPPEVVRLSEPVPSSVSGDMTQQSRIAAALTKAGITNPGAWAAAGLPRRSVAVDEAPRVTQVSVSGNAHVDKPEAQSTFDLTPPVVLMKGENNPAFLISWRSQQDFVRSLAWKSAAMVWGGAALTLLGIYVLLAQLELL